MSASFAFHRGASARINGWALQSYRSALAHFDLLSNIEADLRVSARYGATATYTYIAETSWLDSVTPHRIQDYVVPMLNAGFLLQPSDACSHSFRAQAHLFTGFLHFVLKRNTIREKLPITIRLSAVLRSSSGPEVIDPRPASTLVNDLPGLEEAALRLQFGIPSTYRLRQGSWADFMQRVIMPHMQAKLARNRDLFTGLNVEDLPGLLRQCESLAPRCRSHPSHLASAAEKRKLFRDPVLVSWR